jgi:hypothetical protein
MKASANISTPHLTLLLNSHQTDANRETDFIEFNFTAIFLWFADLKTKRHEMPDSNSNINKASTAYYHFENKNLFNCFISCQSIVGYLMIIIIHIV